MYHQTNAFSGSASDLVTPGHAAHSSTIEVLKSRFTRVRRHRFSDGLEAMVTVTFRYHPALPARSETLLVSLPRSTRNRPGRLRTRMTDMAVELAVLMHRTDRGAPLRPI